jgi:transcriptional regulator with XRE-family HTH domain
MVKAIERKPRHTVERCSHFHEAYGANLSVSDLIQSDDVATLVILEARERAGLTQTELARRAGTSRPTLSAYEHGRVSPTVDTFERILHAAGFRLATAPVLTWQEVDLGRGRVAPVPDRLPDRPTRDALRRLELPLHLEWSRSNRTVDLADRRQRAQAYEVALRKGRPSDIESIVDGALLVDLWDDLVLPRRLRDAWQPLIDDVRGGHG